MNMTIYNSPKWDIYIISQTGETLDVRVVFRPDPKNAPRVVEYGDRVTIPSSLEGELRSLGDKVREGLLAPSDIEKYVKWNSAILRT